MPNRLWLGGQAVPPPTPDTMVRVAVMPFRCARGAWAKNEEPSINEVLAEPIARAMMERDGVDKAEVRRLLANFIERPGTGSDKATSGGDRPASTPWPLNPSPMPQRRTQRLGG